MSGGVHYYARPGTIRLAPWPDKVPFTRGDERTAVDVVLYVGLLAALVVSLALPGIHTPESTGRLAPTTASSRRWRSWP